MIWNKFLELMLFSARTNIVKFDAFIPGNERSRLNSSRSGGGGGGGGRNTRDEKDG